MPGDPSGSALFLGVLVQVRDQVIPPIILRTRWRSCSAHAA